MEPIDWVLVVLLNFFVIAYGTWRSRRTTSSHDWLVASRSLPFWIVGLSMFATSVDGGDYISNSGAVYQHGLAMVAVWWLSPVGAVIAGWFVLPPMYRAGMVTNAEYLEARFGVTARVLSVFVQIQYRGVILAIVARALHLALTDIAHVESGLAWWVVGCFALATMIYVSLGGLKTVAVTDVLLSAIMIISAVVLWTIVSREVGGWSGAEARITAQEGAERARQMLHIGAPRPQFLHPVVLVLGHLCVATGYAVVNHSQTMKMFGARSLWDVKMSAVIVGASSALIIFFIGSLGIFGRALEPGLESSDSIFPYLVDRYVTTGFKGLVLAGVVAAAISSFEGIGSALAALFTCDVYARVLVRNASDRHYLRVSRIASIAIVGLSFLFIPGILNEATMIDFFFDLTSAFVTPLLTIYLMGVFTRVHRKAGVIGLLAGFTYGVVRLLAISEDLDLFTLPFWFTERFVAYLWSLGVTASAMIGASMVFGWESTREVVRPENQDEGRAVIESPFAAEGRAMPLWARPGLWAVLVVLGSLVAVFGVFW